MERLFRGKARCTVSNFTLQVFTQDVEGLLYFSDVSVTQNRLLDFSGAKRG